MSVNDTCTWHAFLVLHWPAPTCRELLHRPQTFSMAAWGLNRCFSFPQISTFLMALGSTHMKPMSRSKSSGTDGTFYADCIWGSRGLGRLVCVSLDIGSWPVWGLRGRCPGTNTQRHMVLSVVVGVLDANDHPFAFVTGMCAPWLHESAYI